MAEKTREDWLEEAASWICYDGPTDMEGIMQEIKNSDEIEDKEQYAAKLLEYIDLLLDTAKTYGAECAGCEDLGDDPHTDMQRHLDTWGYSKPLETRPNITCGKVAESAWKEGYLEARTAMYRTQKEV